VGSDRANGRNRTAQGAMLEIIWADCLHLAGRPLEWLKWLRKGPQYLVMGLHAANSGSRVGRRTGEKSRIARFGDRRGFPAEVDAASARSGTFKKSSSACTHRH
jgi:hypothetical protein